MLGFIYTRCVQTEETNRLWLSAYTSIRKHYPNNIIMIIDDNSNYDYIKTPESIHLTNVFIVQSEFSKCGELLAYYYFNKYQFLFDKAVVLHDSAFIQQPIEIDTITDIKFIWHFHHDWDNEKLEKTIIEKSCLKQKSRLLIEYDNKEGWSPCFGVQSIITIHFLARLIENYDIFALLKIVDTREKRMAVERIFGFLCCLEKPELNEEPSLYGTIHNYCPWSYTYEKYITNPLQLPIIKVWSGR
jgi:hypothetical protein